MKKKLLLLGGSDQQLVAIDTAKRLGYETILCDYLPDNPGQFHADRFYPASTTDKEAILRIAEEEKIDGILAYASDPAAPTAAYVAEKLGLPGNPYESVEILCRKDRFRKFLSENGFCTPKAKGYHDIAAARSDLESGFFRFPVLVKPTDSSGSKGVSRIDSAQDVDGKLQSAFDRSRTKTIVIEEWVEKYGYQIAGDGLSIDGRLAFRYFGNDHFDESNDVNPFVPTAASFPSILPESVQNMVHDEIQRLLTLLGMKTCTYNFDIRIDKDGNVYLMEIAPRSGGNYIPDILTIATGVDLIACAVKNAMGEKITLPEKITPKGFYAYYALHSRKKGILREIRYQQSIRERHLVAEHIKTKRGDMVTPFSGADNCIGIDILKFESMEQMLSMIEHTQSWVSIELEALS